MRSKKIKKYEYPLCAVEVVTTYYLRGISGMFIDKYIVVARSPSAAIAALPLREGETVVSATQMNHKLIIAK